MDFTFCYILADWEGSIHNNQILKDVLFNKDFCVLNQKYYLANARYHNTSYLFYPYYRVCYHLKEQIVVKKNLVNKEKLFNFYHSSLCNSIERIFEVTK